MRLGRLPRKGGVWAVARRHGSRPGEEGSDRTNLSSRLSLERLAAGALDPALASFLWDPLSGIAPERIKDRRFDCQKACAAHVTLATCGTTGV
ncbi:MAG TPA: hypothetical protein VGW38_04820 [Chloroflexota bacterium]|nr:hypothetical protein [Chloroflexota bacterium]